MSSKVLVVEDEIFVAIELESLLHDLGHQPVGIAADSRQALALAAVSGGVSAHNHGGQGGESTLVSFCARSQSTALLEADSRGAGLFWLFALFQNGRLAVGEERD